MWAPSEVVGKHRKRASVVWILLLALIFAYGIWLFVRAQEKRKNPAVSVWLEAERYLFPTISICFTADEYAGYGCDAYDAPCASTASTWVTKTVGFILNESYPEYTITNEEYPTQCIDIRLADIPQSDETLGLFPAQISFETIWVPNVTDQYAYQVFDVSESVYVFLTDPEISNPLGFHNQSSFVGDIPYTRQLAGTEARTFTPVSITMAMTESIDLDETPKKKYFASSVTSTTLQTGSGYYNSGVNDYDVGVLMISMVQPDLSYTKRKEVDPLEWAELVGSVGGTWEFLLIVWGVLFVTAQTEEPRLKGRNLKKTVQRGLDGVVKGAQTVASIRIIGGKKRAPSTFVDMEARPHWQSGGNVTVAAVSPPIQRAHVREPALTPDAVAEQKPEAPLDAATEMRRNQPRSGFFMNGRSSKRLTIEHHDDEESNSGRFYNRYRSHTAGAPVSENIARLS